MKGIRPLKKLINPIELYLTLSLFLLISSSSPKGLYTLKAYNTDIKLLLKENHSFLKSMNINSTIDSFYGKWSQTDDTLFLTILKPNVFFNVDSLSIVEEQTLSNNNKIYFEVYYDNNTVAAFARIQFNGKKILTDSMGKATINKTHLSKIFISLFNNLIP